MAIAITAKNTETIIIPCYKVLSMDMDFLGSQNCPKSSKAFKTSPRRPKTVPGATRVECRVRYIKKLELKSYKVHAMLFVCLVSINCEDVKDM